MSYELSLELPAARLVRPWPHDVYRVMLRPSVARFAVSPDVVLCDNGLHIPASKMWDYT